MTKKHDIDKEQLMPEQGFVRYCNDDGYVGSGHRFDITPEFLHAAQQDGLLEPLLRVASEGEVADYYSPFQLFLVAGLHKNVLKDGRLSSERQMAWGPGTYRTILWGDHYGFTVDASTGKPIGLTSLNLHEIAEDFHNFLRLLYENRQFTERDYTRLEQGRYFRMAPDGRFDFGNLQKDGLKALTRNALTTEKLTVLRHAVGSFATHIDPLEHWYEYIKRHEQWRRDKFKGQALLAQELYIVEQLIADALEVVTGTSQPPLRKFLHGDSSIRPFLTPEESYASGIDAKALQACLVNVKKWLEDPENKAVAPATATAKLDSFERQIEEFIQLYGSDRSYLSGVSRPVEYDDMPLDKLDPITRQYAEDMIKRLNPKDPEYEDDYQMEVAQAIETRLLFMRHVLGDAIAGIRDALSSKEDAAWRNLKDAETWQKSKEEQQKLNAEAKSWQAKRNEFAEVWKDFHLVYCQECRINPVRLHHDNGDRQLSTDPICDDCFSKVADDALKMSESDWQKAKGGEWRCDYCVDPKSGQPPILYKFAQRNTVSLWSKNNTPIKMQLDYGRATLEAKCSKCGHVQRREIDWGWTI